MASPENPIPDPNPNSHHHHRRRVCFSFAAYSKAVIDHLRASQIPIAAGLSDLEFTSIESTFNLRFPPDLRSILREGLPIGPGFPNWRSSSPRHLRLLLSLPTSGLLNEISKSNLSEPSETLIRARSLLSSSAPPLVPIYRHFYIASIPNLAGNPIFYVRGGDVRCAAFDIADFFRREEFRFRSLAPPAWAAKSARRVEVWSEIAEGDTWRAGREGLDAKFKEMGWRLREAGWREEEVREMMTAGGSNGGDEGRKGDRTALKDRESVIRHVRLLALALLRAGWSRDDVADAMGGGARPEKKEEATWHVGHTPNGEISLEL